MPTMQSFVCDRYKLLMIEKAVNLATDALTIILMRADFAQVVPFNTKYYVKRINVNGNSGAIGLTFSNTPAKITRAAGNFWTAGFAPGNYITTNSANPANQGPFLVYDIDLVGPGLWMQIVDLTGADPTLTAGVEAAITITFEDQLPTAGGYVQDANGMSAYAAVQYDTGGYAYIDFDPVNFGLAMMGDIAPTAGALIWDDDAAADEIVGFFDFGGNESSTWPDYLTVGNMRFKIA